MNRGIERTWNFALTAGVVYLAIGALREVAGPGAIVAIVAAAVVAPFILGPFLIYKTHRSALDPGLTPFDPDGSESPEALRSHFARTSAELDRLGFTPERYYRTYQAVTNADGAVLLFRNAKTRETARVLTAASNDSTISTSFTVFSSEFSDGTTIVTSNRASARVFPLREPPFHGRAFPQVHDVGRLLVVHRARVDNLAAGLIPVDPVGNDPDGYIRRVDFDEPHTYHVACGYTYVDETARAQRMTWKGAVLTTWRLLPPIKQIRLAWERRTSARQLGNLNAGRPVF